MDELTIEVRATTYRPGREPIHTAEKITLTSKELHELSNWRIRGLAGQEAAHLVKRAQETEVHDRSVSEWAVLDTLDATLREAHQNVLEQDVRDKIDRLNTASAKLKEERDKHGDV